MLGAVELEASSGRKPYRSLSSGLVGGQKQTARISGKPLQVVPGIAFLCVCALWGVWWVRVLRAQALEGYSWGMRTYSASLLC